MILELVLGQRVAALDVRLINIKYPFAATPRVFDGLVSSGCHEVFKASETETVSQDNARLIACRAIFGNLRKRRRLFDGETRQNLVCAVANLISRRCGSNRRQESAASSSGPAISHSARVGPAKRRSPPSLRSPGHDAACASRLSISIRKAAFRPGSSCAERGSGQSRSALTLRHYRAGARHNGLTIA
jgi:hypothetical protein